MRWTVLSTGEMTMIADSRIVRRERFLADVTTHRATVCLPLLFRQCFHVSGYDIFHVMCQIVELLRKPLYSLHLAGSNITIMCRRIVIAYAKR